MPLRQLYPDPNTTSDDVSKVDIIAVHGLNPRSKKDADHAWDTWRTPSGPQGRLWLRDDLPRYVPESRIFLYEYNASAVYGKDRDTFIGKANELLEATRIERDEVESRPILFLGHSMGGLLIKQALINAHNNPKYSPIKDATVGLAFFATPHHGGDMMLVSLGGVAAKIATTVGFQKGDDVLETLKKGSIFSDIMQEHWRHQLLKYDIISFWGASDNIVSAESARFGMPGDHENIVKLNADHSGVCKFGPSQTDQDNFKLVRSNVKDLYKHALNVASKKRMFLDQESQLIADWLTPVDYGSQQSDYIGRRQPGTGQWLLESAAYQEWLEGQKQTLFCPGIPGAGKTIITSIVIEELTTHFQFDKKVGIAYLYLNFRQQDDQKAKDLLASLLKQLTVHRSSLSRAVKELHERHKKPRTRPSFDEISKALHSISTEYSRVFIVIDALDECKSVDGCRTRFLSEIFSLQAKQGVNVFATSRFIPEITEKFDKGSPIEIRASDEDVQKYLDGQMFILPGFVDRSPALQEEIKTAIIKAVDGMFLLAQLHLKSLVGKTSPKKVRDALKKLPTGSEAYDYAYQNAMERIERQAVDEKELAMQVLSWIVCAKRPLKTTELQHALAVEIDEPELDEENFPEIENMVSICAGLVTVDEDSEIIRLVHYTTQEYFERTQKDWFVNAESDITIICVTYLSFRVFESGYCQTDEEFEERLRSNWLYDYAAHNWGHHASKALTLCQQVVDFLESELKIQAASQALLATKWYSSHFEYSQEVPRQITGPHLAAYFGLKEAMTTLLGNGHDLNSRDSYGQTPLLWAAEKGHEAIVKLLVERGAELETRDKYGRTPLSRAAEKGHEAIVKLLVERGAELETKDDKIGWTPLSRAAEKGHEAVVKLLVERGAELE